MRRFNALRSVRVALRQASGDLRLSTLDFGMTAGNHPAAVFKHKAPIAYGLVMFALGIATVVCLVLFVVGTSHVNTSDPTNIKGNWEQTYGLFIGLGCAVLLGFLSKAWPVASPLRPAGMTSTGRVQRREPIPQRVRNEVWNRDGGHCVDCGSRERLEYDHIIPVSRGGSNTARNIELRCERCNRSKGARI